MSAHSNVREIILKLRNKTAELAPNSPNLRAALERIGFYVAALAKMEARRQGIWDTGRLINSIRHEFFRKGTVVGVMIGSFNVKYAAMHEFGGQFTDRMRRAMFAAMNRRGGRQRASKGVISGGRFKARPYLRPAFAKSRLFVIDTLRAAVTFAKEP